ncbi:peptide-methionine (R)-S-oxide reductase MsrB [Saccharopolyspora sp. NFXS83]|uniref:peptide-methionine (R)-S-oxide reductase MsrB n=1 Tax=Saccharopolyspora sp. NFXS83 TaxID=2993560 RepID=UPI00224ABDE5|nr:peptide-methionine (R)-S-oxide reductase MsrB [Saccharopolyspora sp. NFXS83]MCX2730895.1 peptide-methionine (R)-S-oxide reductase MsrB [Saccharopolyspora sp. NFXS83]
MEPVAGATPKVVKSEQEWQEQLNPYEYAVLREAATEPAWSGEYVETKTAGVYECRACGTELFRSETKFESHCGWPSFYDARDTDSVILREDRSHGMVRVEVLCANCLSHLGHLFEGEGYATPTDQRYCINSVALRHIPES